MHLEKNRILTVSCLALVLVLAIFLLPKIGLAQTYDEGLGQVQEITQFSDQPLTITIAKIIRWVLGFLGLIALILLIYAGFMWMTSAGNPERIEKAKKIMISAVIGMLIIVTAFAITTFLIRSFGGGLGGIFGCREGDIRNSCFRCKAEGTWECVSELKYPDGSSCADICVSWWSGISFFRVASNYPTGLENEKVPLCPVVWVEFNKKVDENTVENNVRVFIKDGKGADESCAENSECASAKCEAEGSLGSPIVCKGNIVAGEAIKSETNSSRILWRGEKDFEESKEYRVVIGEGLKSEEGLALLGGHGWNFKTGTERLTTPPKVEKTEPVNGEGNVCLESRIWAEFDHPMDIDSLEEKGSILITPRLLEGEEDDFYREGREDNLTATPQKNYETATSYTPVLDSLIIKDVCGNYMEEDYSWQFTTGGLDKQRCPPEITEITEEEYYDEGLVTIKGFYFENEKQGVMFSANAFETDRTCFSGTDKYARSICVASWNDKEIKLRIPARKSGLAGGETNGAISGPVRVVTGKTDMTRRVSNAMDTRVLSPFINSVSPKKGGRGQYVTVSGVNFGGLKGKVFFVRGDYSDDESVFLEFEAEFPPSPCPETWREGQIIIKVNSADLEPGDYYIQTETIEGHRSNLLSFEVLEGEGGPGICQMAPVCGIVGGPVDIRGEKFGSVVGEVYFGEEMAGISEWGEAKIMALAPEGIEQGNSQVKVKNAIGESNSLNFRSPCEIEVSCDTDLTNNSCDPGACSGNKVCNSDCECEGAPEILNQSVCPPQAAFPFNSPSPRSVDNCIHSLITMIFSEPMDVDSLENEDNYEFLKCNTLGNIDCTEAEIVENIEATAYEIEGVQKTGVYVGLDDGGPLEKNTWYRFKVKGVNGVFGISNIYFKNDYVWNFKTADSDSCEVSEIGVRSQEDARGEPYLILEKEVFEAIPYPSGCNYVLSDNLDFNFVWSSTNGEVATVSRTDETTAEVAAKRSGTCSIKALDDKSNKYGNAMVIVNKCTKDTDCVVSDLGGAVCDESTCDTDKGLCKPDITLTGPAGGKVGTWATLQGCWFGERTGSVTSNDGLVWGNPEEKNPDCGDTWSNNQVIVEVPEGSVLGEKKLTLGANYGSFELESKNGDTDANFTVNDVLHPSVCKLEPQVTEVGYKINVLGKSFGSEQTGTDGVFFEVTKATVYDEWEDVKIKVEVHVSARTGNLKVLKDGSYSNPIILRVVVDLPEVEEVSGCNPGYGLPSPNPTKGAKDVCLNAVVTGRFNMQEIDETTVKTPNIKLECDGAGCVVPHDVRVRDYGNVKGFEIRPQVNLFPNTVYKVTVEKIVVEGHPDLIMEPYTWEFTTGNKICEIDSISVSPEEATVVKLGNQDYVVRMTNEAKCFELREASAADWTSSDTDIATADFGPSISTTARAKNVLGQTNITATHGVFSDFGVLKVIGKPSIKDHWPRATTDPVCRNAVVEIVFDQLMDRSTLNKINMYLLEGGLKVDGQLRIARTEGADERCLNSSGCTQVRFIPDELLEESGMQPHQFGITGDVRSSNGLNFDGVFWTFDVDNEICAIDRAEIEVSPDVINKTRDIFVCAGRNGCVNDQDGVEDGNQHKYEVVYYSGINPIMGGIVKWDPTSDSNIYEFLGEEDGVVINLTSKPKEGKDELKVKVKSNPNWLKVGIDAHEVDAKIDIINWLCENPWPSLESFPYEDGSVCGNTGGAPCIDFNFSTFYCRDKGDDKKVCVGGSNPGEPCTIGGDACLGGRCDDEDDLRAMGLDPVVKKFDVFEFEESEEDSQPAQTENLLKEIIFSVERKEGGGQDVIGVRIFNNDDHYSPGLWYRAQGKEGKLSSAGEVDGYPAASQGRSVYVTASADSRDTGKIYTNVYVISYNQDADEETKEIFNRIISNWKFNTNVESNKEELVRDTNRLIHFSDLAGSTTAPLLMANTLEYYAGVNRGVYPSLREGSYIKGFSVSLWEDSWIGELGKQIGKIFVDPINEFSECPEGHNDESCWNGTEGVFVCPAGSHVYTYQSSGTGGYVLASDFEFETSNTWQNLDNSRFKTADVCLGNTKFGVSEVCGDGVLDLTNEVCERGQTRFYWQDALGVVVYNDYKQECDLECKGWTPNKSGHDYGGFCKNGTYEEGKEICDPLSAGRAIKEAGDKSDSIYNQYTCGNECKWSTGGWCGDGVRQHTTTGFSRDYEVCDGDLDTASCDLPGGHAGVKINSCEPDCSGFTGFGECLSQGVCGDGEVNGADETCDEGGSNGSGFCRTDCTYCGDKKIQAGYGEVCEVGIDIPDNAVCDNNCLGWSCKSGYRENLSECELDHCEGDPSKECTITNGKGEQTRTCDLTAHPPAWGAWGTCQVKSCNFGYREYNDTCELDHCEGDPSKACAITNGTGEQTRTCDLTKHDPDWGAWGTCQVASCSAGYADCNNNPADGCEVNLNTNLSNCGTCGKVCPGPPSGGGSATCASGQCGINCNAGYNLVGGDCVSSTPPPPPPPPPPVGGDFCGGSTMTIADCAAAGGQVVTIPEGCNLCRFDADRCPTGTNWGQYNNWSTAVRGTRACSGWDAFTCSYTLGACKGQTPANINVSSNPGYTIGSGSGHAWSNTSLSLYTHCCNPFVYNTCSQSRNDTNCDNPDLSFNYVQENGATCYAGGPIVGILRSEILYLSTGRGGGWTGAILSVGQRRCCANAVKTQVGCR
ncbi:Ig-like domain-containing protein [Candidatus Falkowbacteria bacterium]|nr:Ig-like domain-containing protein [Candidatus Falkowbacteria bacterium]